MTTNEYREKYSKNVDALDKLYILLEESRKGTYTDFDEKTILSSIEELNKEQEFYSKQIRRNLCDKYNEKMLFKCKQDIKNAEFIERGKEIIVQPKFVSNFVSDVIAEPFLIEKKVNQNDESLRDVTEVLIIGMKDETISNDITEVLTSDMKVDTSCDDITEVLTADKRLKKDILPKKRIFNKIKTKVASVAAAALILIGGLGVSKRLQKNETIDNTKENNTEYTTEELTTEVQPIESKEDVSLIKEEPEKKTEKEVKSTIDQTLELKNEEKEEEIKETDIKIGDIVSFENADLHYTSLDDTSASNTDIIDSNKYDFEATAISVVYEDKVVASIKDDSASLLELEEEYQEKYGEDVKISFNFDVVDKERNTVSEFVGWIDDEDVKTKSKVLKR